LFTAKNPEMATRLISFEAWREGMKRLPFVVPTVRFLRNHLGPHQRSVWKLQKNPLSKLLQPSAVTFPDRYPDLFSYIQDQLANAAQPYILSYGCSTGEEVFALRHYFPNGKIKGIDINPRLIRQCQRQLSKTPVSNVEFAVADSPANEPTSRYDAVFCMAVLRHGILGATMPDRCDAHIRFDDVAALVNDLARCIKPGGFLVIKHSHFRFADMPAASQFAVVWSHNKPLRDNEPLYGPDNARLDTQPYRDVIFRKRPF
jgi:SAM-dependent methyltransferase